MGEAVCKTGEAVADGVWTMQRMTLGQLLGRSDALSWTSALYLPITAHTLSLSTPCCVLEEDEDEENAETANYVAQNDFKYVLGIQAVQDIVANARTQKSDVSSTELLGALEYYLKRDAFIRLDTPE